MIDSSKNSYETRRKMQSDPTGKYNEAQDAHHNDRVWLKLRTNLAYEGINPWALSLTHGKSKKWKSINNLRTRWNRESPPSTLSKDLARDSELKHVLLWLQWDLPANTHQNFSKFIIQVLRIGNLVKNYEWYRSVLEGQQPEPILNDRIWFNRI